MKAGEEIQKYTECLGVPCGASGQLGNCSIGLNAGDCVKAADCMYTYDVSFEDARVNKQLSTRVENQAGGHTSSCAIC